VTPNHDLFRNLFSLCNVRVDTYDYLPDAETKYPFVYLGENNGSDIPNNDVLGTVRQTIHLYGLREHRAHLDKISAYLEGAVKLLKDGHEHKLAHLSTSKQVIPDNTDVQPLIHIVLDVTFNYTKKET
jgi:hypothetical protein